jgi:hypothetical protein
MQALGIIIKYVCENHMIHAVNCGENYVPYSRVNNTPNAFDVKLFKNPDAFSPQETESLAEIFKGIMSRTNLIDIGTIATMSRTNLIDIGTIATAEYHIPDSVIRESLANDPVVNLWLTPVDDRY